MRLKLTQEDLIVLFGVILSLSTVFIAFTFFLGDPRFFGMLIISLFFLIGPYLLTRYMEYRKIKEMERYFPPFLRSVAESKRSGITLPRAIQLASQESYGALTPEIRKLAITISFGIPFEEALRRMSARVKSKLIKRSIFIIIEAYRSGGKIEDILETVARDAVKVQELEKERAGRLKTYLVTMYFIFFIFLFVIVLLEKTLLPTMPQLSSLSKFFGVKSGIDPGLFKEILFHMAIIQAFFNGLVAGQMGEGNVLAGVKHSIIMVLIGFAVMLFIITPEPPEELITRAIISLPYGAEASMDMGSTKVFKTFRSSDVIAKLREKVKQGWVEEIGPEDIIFVQSPGCRACMKGYVTVYPDRVEVKRETSLSFKVHSEKGKYLIEVG